MKKNSTKKIIKNKFVATYVDEKDIFSKHIFSTTN
jgi:hypothetical protein